MRSCLLELIHPDGLVKDVGWLEGLKDGEAKKSSIETMTRVVNQLLLQQAVRQATEKLLVCFSNCDDDESGDEARQVFIREQMPLLYNELWDLGLENDKMDLNSIVLMSSAKQYIEAGHQVDVIWNAGRNIDGWCFSQDTKVNTFEDYLQEAVFGVPYVLYDNIGQAMPKFETVAVGGTFDHFHNGHKKLLAICCSVCRGELVCGVTDASMLKEKSNGSLIESLAHRKASVEEFLAEIANPSMKQTICTIVDVWGPTVQRPDIQAIVCSTEVLKGARLINEERRKKGFDLLEVVAVARTNAHTLSSSFIRKFSNSTSSI